MDLFGKDIIRGFQNKHPASKKALEKWVAIIEACMARNPMELKKTFNTIDVVPPQTVFDICGNNYRLIADIDYPTKTIIVTHVLTHTEYMKNRRRVMK